MCNKYTKVLWQINTFMELKSQPESLTLHEHAGSYREATEKLER